MRYGFTPRFVIRACFTTVLLAISVTAYGYSTLHDEVSTTVTMSAPGRSVVGSEYRCGSPSNPLGVPAAQPYSTYEQDHPSTSLVLVPTRAEVAALLVRAEAGCRRALHGARVQGWVVSGVGVVLWLVLVAALVYWRRNFRYRHRPDHIDELIAQGALVARAPDPSVSDEPWPPRSGR